MFLSFCNAQEQVLTADVNVQDDIFSIATQSTTEKSDISELENQDVEQEERDLNSWDKVAALYLPSLVETVEKFQKLTRVNLSDESKKEESFSERMETIMSQGTRDLEKALTPDSTDYINQTFMYFANEKNETINLHDELTAIFDDTTYKDLNLFCGKEDNLGESFFNIINNTQTVAGRAALLDMLYNPLVDIESLLARQNGIKRLINDEELYKFIQEKLSIIKNAEQTLFLILNEMHYKLVSKITDRFYFKSIFDLPLSVLIRYIPFGSMIPLVDFLPPMKKFNAYVCGKLNKRSGLLEFSRFEKYFYQMTVTPAICIGLSGLFGAVAYDGIQENDFDLAVKAGISSAALAALTYFVVTQTYSSLKYETKSENMLHSAIGKLAQMTTALKELQQIVEQDSKLSQLVPFKNFEKEAEQANGDFRKLLVLLGDKNFKKQATWMTFKGKMMAVLKLVQNLKYKVVQPYLENGKLDALMSAAILYKKQAGHSNACYHFVNYKEQKTPHLVMNNFWNPFLDPDTVITNSLELGTSSEHRNVLITGPNAGGKSTALKAIAYSVLLAQTLTVANADITLTPFSKVFTTIDITDTVGKESLYQADKNRVKTVTKTLASLDAGQKALLISDELFNSTGASYGAALFYGTLNYINNSLKNTLFAAATHFENLVELEVDTNGSVANFRVEEAKVNSEGKLAWSYKIKPGINRQNISFELAQEDGFSDELLNAGMKFLNRHTASVN